MPLRATAKAFGLGLLLAASAASGNASVDSVAMNLPPSAELPATEDFPDATLVRVDGADSTVLLRIDGIITTGLEKRFDAAIDDLPEGKALTVELSSPGGFTSPGYRMIDRILALRRAGRTVATRVRAGEACESMCVGLYLAGYPRYAAPSAEFMVHAPRLAHSGDMTLRSTEAMATRLVSLGASTDWIARVKAAGGFSGARDYRESADRLTADHANVVTELLR